MNNGSITDPARDIARTIYTECDKSVSETAALIGKSEDVLRLWITEGAWDLQRRTLAASRKKQLDQLYLALGQLQREMDEDPSLVTKKLDLMLKYAAVIKNLDADGSIYGIVEAAQQFITWLYPRDAESAKTFTRLFDEFIKTKKAA